MKTLRAIADKTLRDLTSNWTIREVCGFEDVVRWEETTGIIGMSTREEFQEIDFRLNNYKKPPVIDYLEDLQEDGRSAVERSILGPQRIGSIFIPGTHNSGAYGVTFLHDIIRDFILNQNTNIWAQLVFGIRYLDLRIGYYENEGFFINHDLIRIRRLEPELRAIRKFLELSPKEVVIIDFHRFPYPTIFTNDMHRKLIDVVDRELGHLALQPAGLQMGKGPTLNEIWQYNKSLIICYGQRQIAKEYQWLWNPLQQYWGDKQNAPDLKTYLQASIKSHNTITNPLWALMAELTISPIDVLFNSASNYQLADKVNRKLTKWFRDEWAIDANIVATDYFLGNDLVNIAIEANKLR